jgi:hypothetical protein
LVAKVFALDAGTVSLVLLVVKTDADRLEIDDRYRI